MSQLRHRFASTLATLSLSVAVALASANAVAQQPEHAHQTDPSASYGQEVAATNPAAQRKAATESTEAFISARKQWAQAQGASNKAVALQNLIAKAEARQDMLAELIQTNPAEVLRVAIPDEKQIGMPAEVLAMLEQHLEIEGELETVYEDYEDGTHKPRHFLKTPFGERFEVHLAGNETIPNGASIRLNGLLIEDGLSGARNADGNIVVNSEDVDILYCCTSGGSTTSSSTEANASGERRALVVMVNYQDSPSEPWTQDEIHDLVFNQSNNYFEESSYGQIWYTGDVIGWTTANAASGSCDTDAFEAAANAAATAAGKDLTSYTDYVYYLAPGSGCGFTGAALTNGRVFIAGTTDPDITVHELGHSLGLFHAHSLDCGSETLSESCTHKIYGDAFDVMGGTFSQFSPFNKELLGWIGEADSSIVTAEQSGQYQLDVYETGLSSTPKALKVLRSIDPDSGAKTWFYVEYRQGVGVDAWLDDPAYDSSFYDRSNVINGVLVRLGTDADADSSYLLDMTPDNSFLDAFDSALEAGYSFYDAASGVTISTLMVDGNNAVVDVQYDAPVCVPSMPVIEITTEQNGWVVAGTEVQYSLSVTNTDSANCPAGDFQLSRSVPTGWSSSLATESLTLAPGQSASTVLTVTSSVDTVDGFYSISASATSSNALSATASADYVIDSPVMNTAPTAQNDNGATISGSPVTITVLSNDSDAEQDPLTVQSVFQASHGSTQLNADGSITYTPEDGFVGIDSFSYTISDGNGGTASATVTIEIAAAVNGLPIATDDNAQISDKVAVVIEVLNNDSDPDGDALSLVSATQGAKGSVAITAGGTLVYTPHKSFKNSDSFSYTISDGQDSATAQVTIQLVSATGGGDNNTNQGKGKKR